MMMPGMPPGPMGPAPMPGMAGSYSYMPGQWAMPAPMGAMAPAGAFMSQHQYSMLAPPVAAGMVQAQDSTGGMGMPFHGMQQQGAGAARPPAQRHGATPAAAAAAQQSVPASPRAGADLTMHEPAGSDGMMPPLSSDMPGGHDMSKLGQESRDLLDPTAEGLEPCMGSAPEDIDDFFNSILEKDGQRGAPE